MVAMLKGNKSRLVRATRSDHLNNDKMYRRALLDKCELTNIKRYVKDLYSHDLLHCQYCYYIIIMHERFSRSKQVWSINELILKSAPR